MPNQSTGSREVALQLLLKIKQQHASLSDLLPLNKTSLSATDQALVAELVYGVCRWYQRLDCLLSQLVNKPLRSRDLDIQLLLMLGVYQLLFTRIPAHAAINETVQVTRYIKKDWASKMVNAILRRVGREQKDLLQKLSGNPDYRFSHPQWLIKRLQRDYPDLWQQICDANNARAPLCLRVNQQKGTQQDYLETLNQEGINATVGTYAPHALVLEQAKPVDSLPGFAAGLCSVQDESAQLAATLLAPCAGERILDACAAPGGKTCHLLEQQPKLGELIALDISAERCERIHENLERLNLQAKVIAADAANPEQWWDGSAFDRILLDAPCSATGVIRRHPDIKLLRQPEDIAKLAEHQLALIKTLWATLKPGGLLLYATCSVLVEENDEVVGKFLAQQPDASHRLLEVDWGIRCKWGRQLLPADGSHDGFYYALIKKSDEIMGMRP